MFRTGFRPTQLLASILFFFLASITALADSHVRIVRLSYIEGGVQVDRGTGQFEKAITNLPIAESAKLRTLSDGRAEVEFEDGSTIRMIPESTLEFPELALRDSGAKVSTVELKNGTAYVDYGSPKNDEFTIRFARETVKLSRSARLRVAISKDNATLAVFKGGVQVEDPSGSIQVKKNQTGTFDLSNDDSFTLAKSIDEQPFDNWDKQQSDFHSRYASSSYNSYSPYAYGTTDLAYYGNFFNAPGYGMLWQPYFVGAGWDPFMNGAWAFSPGWGFGWVSAYPWGWTPYHYGSWVFLPAYGWVWQPGGSWTPWYVQPRVVNPPRGFGAPQAPTGGRTMVVVNRGPASTWADQSRGKLVISNNSAGLGIRRGEINNLSHVSRQVQGHGSTTERVRVSPMNQRPAWVGGVGDGANSSGAHSNRSSRSTHQSSAPAPAPPVRSNAPPPPSSGGQPHK
jgi:hypothetical protein